MIRKRNILYIYAKNQFEITGVVVPGGGKPPYQRGGQPAAGSADPNGGAFGGVASLKGQAGRGRGSIARDGLNDPIVPGMISIEGIPLMKPPYGTVTALDVAKGTKVWQVVHGETPDAIKNHPLLKGVTIPRTGQSGILGTLTTKTLVILGDCGLFTDEHGRKGARLRAYDKATGEERGAVFMDKVQTGAAMTYMHGGKQYIVTAVGGSYGADLLAFALPGEVRRRDRRARNAELDADRGGSGRALRRSGGHGPDAHAEADASRSVRSARAPLGASGRWQAWGTTRRHRDRPAWRDLGHRPLRRRHLRRLEHGGGASDRSQDRPAHPQHRRAASSPCRTACMWTRTAMSG